jgi:NAD(P)-dependent dehydrogenase (short-subunit alcohol dehydrogenase family)
VIIDVSHPDTVNTLTSRTLEYFGRVDLVANNVGIATSGG